MVLALRPYAMDQSLTPSFNQISYQISSQSEHRLLTTYAVFAPGNETLVQALGTYAGPQTKVLFVIERQLLAIGYQSLVADIEQKSKALSSEFTLAATVELDGGEPCKDSWEGVLMVCAAIDQYGIDRHSFVVAIGGGAFLDMVGFAASIAHRGVKLIRIPTTALAQADSGVGVKSAINQFGKKNFIGAFGVPHAVINDAQFLQTLTPQLIREGLAEVIKVALIKDIKLFERLEQGVDQVYEKHSILQELVSRSAQLHLEHICLGGDPFEQGSSRPLDFGHWSAHKIESLSGFKIPHGLAVAAGIHLDCLYAYRKGWLPESSYLRIKGLLIKLGYQLNFKEYHLLDDTGQLQFVKGLNEFREHLGGQLTLLMLKDIGQPFEVHEVEEVVLERVVNEIATL